MATEDILLTGDCPTEESIPLIPDNPDDVLPPGYVPDGILPGVTNPDGSIIADEDSLPVTGSCGTEPTPCPVDPDIPCTEYWCLDDGCPPGCIPDPGDLEYPPGTPSLISCTITSLYGGSTTTFGTRFLEKVGDYLWCGNDSGNSCVLRINEDRTATITKQITGLSRPDGMAVIGDKVVLVEHIVRATNIRVYSEDGTYLESWGVPAGYEYYSSQSRNCVSYGEDEIVISFDEVRLGGIYLSMLVWYDYYGNILRHYTTDASSDISSVKRSGNLLLCGNPYGTSQNPSDSYYSKTGALGIRNATTGEFIKFAERTPYTINNFSRPWGNVVELSSPGKTSMFMAGQFNVHTDDTRDEFYKYRFIYDHNFELITVLDMGTTDIRDMMLPALDGNYPHLVGFNDVKRYGDYIVEGNHNSNALDVDSINRTRGSVRIWKIDDVTGEITFVNTVSGSQPSSGSDGRIGTSAYIEKDKLYMLGSSVTGYTGYIKICDMSWA